MNIFISKNNYIISLIKKIISNLSKSILTSFIFSKFTPLALNFLNGLYTLNMMLQIKLIISTLVLSILLLIIYKVYHHYIKKNKKNKKKQNSFISSSSEIVLNQDKKNINAMSKDNKKKLSYESLLSSSK